MSEEEKKILGCVPVEAMPWLPLAVPDADYKLGYCKDCFCKIWIGRLGRESMKTGHDSYCMPCVMRIAERDGDQVEIEMLNENRGAAH